MTWARVFLMVFGWTTVGICENGLKSSFYELDFEKLGNYYHRATVMTLFKAKAKHLLSSSSRIEQIVFSECSQEADSPSKYAKCLIPLLDERDRNREGQTDRPTTVSVQAIPARESFEIRKIPFTNATTMNVENFGMTAKSIRLRRQRIRRPRRVYSTDELVERRIGRDKRNTKPETRNMRNLRLIRRYYEMSTACSNYLKRISEENDAIYKQMNLPVKTEMQPTVNKVIDEFTKFFRSIPLFNGSSKMSIMSPKILSFFPNHQRRHLLSPSLFSFQKDGVWSLPDILQIVSVGENDADQLLDLILDVSGGSQSLQSLVDKMEAEMTQMETETYPQVQEMIRMDRIWTRLAQTYNARQQQQFRERGYAFLEPFQLMMLQSSSLMPNVNIDLEEYSKMSTEEKEARIENDIRKLAALDHKDPREWPPMYRNADFRRSKREVQHSEGSSTDHPTEEDKFEHHFATLRPFAVFPLVGRGAALEVVTLSPHAFIAEILFPEALTWHTLVPRAFIASVLSPNALVGRVLSPSAFRTDVLSPRALTPFILSPEALMIDILSPKFLETRVLSPEALVIKVLSPHFLNPYVASPEALGVLVLSPTILSPKFRSEGSMMVEILSPEILSGEVEHEHGHEGQEKDHDHNKDKTKDHHSSNEMAKDHSKEMTNEHMTNRSQASGIHG